MHPHVLRLPCALGFLLACGTALTLRTVTVSDTSVQSARDTGKELIRAGDFEKALRHIRLSSERYPIDSELHRLLAVVAFNRAVKLDSDVESARRRYFMTTVMSKATRQSISTAVPNGDVRRRFEAALATARPIVDAERDNARRSYEKRLPLKSEALRLADEAAREAQVALRTGGTDAQTLLLAVWIDAYRVIEASADRDLQARLQRIHTLNSPDTRVEPFGRARQEIPLDVAPTRKYALGLLGRWAQSEPKNPLPYLAAAEWLQLSGLKDTPGLNPLDRIRTLRFVLGGQAPDQQTADTAARLEYQRLLRLPSAELESVTTDEILPLYDRAARLDSATESGIVYGLYLQVLPGNLNRGKRLLETLTQGEPQNALVSLERARLALTVDKHFTQMLRHLSDVRMAPLLHRPLFTTIPDDIRQVFLTSELVWPRLLASGCGFSALRAGLNNLRRSTQSPTEQQRLRYLEAAVGESLMKSDLPLDWVLGAQLRRNALISLLSSREQLPADAATKLRLEFEKLQSEIAAAMEWLPLECALLWQNRVLFVPVVTPDNPRVTPPFLRIDREGRVLMGVH